MGQFVTYKGVTIGGCDDTFTLMMPGITGLGTPEVKTLGELDIYGENGYVAGPDKGGYRTLGIPVGIHYANDPATAMADLALLRETWMPVPDNEMITVTIPGLVGAGGDALNFWGRPRGPGLDVDLSLLYTGTINAFATFVCLDPIGYGGAAIYGIGSPINNPGDALSTRATITLSGAASSVTNTSTGGQTIILSEPLDGGVINLNTQTLTDEFGTNRFDLVQPGSTWFGLAPGDNTLTVNDGDAEVEFRAGWW